MISEVCVLSLGEEYIGVSQHIPVHIAICLSSSQIIEDS